MKRTLLVLLLACSTMAAAAQANNTVYVQAFMKPGTTVGMAAALAQSTCNPLSVCLVVFDPSLALYPMGTLPAPCPFCRWTDFNGQTAEVFGKLPSRTPQGAYSDRSLAANIGGRYTSPSGDSLMNFHAHFEVVTFPIPGWDYGNVAVGPAGWLTRAWYTTYENSFGAGIMGGATLYQAQYGVGDTYGLYIYSTSRGGIIGSSDQGTFSLAANGGEEPQTYVGHWSGSTAAGPVTGSVNNCVSDCGVEVAVNSTTGAPVKGPALGDRLPFLDSSHTLVSGCHIESVGRASGEIPGTLRLDCNKVPVSTAWGTLAAACTAPPAPHAPQPMGVGTVQETCTVKLDGIGSWGRSPGAFVAGQVACFSGQNHATLLIENVTPPSGGTQTVTVNLSGGHEAGSVVMQGGLCGSAYIDALANDGTVQTTPNAGTLLKDPIDVLGAIANDTVVVRRFAYGEIPAAQQWQAGNLLIHRYPVETIRSTADGTVTMALRAGPAGFLPLNHGTVYLQTSNPALNGPCSGFAVSLEYGRESTATCANHSIASEETAASGTVALNCTRSGCSPNPWGNGDVTIYAGSMIIDAQDQATGVIDGNDFAMEANSWIWNDGDRVEVDHHPSASFQSAFFDLPVANPNASTNPVYVSTQGTGIATTSGLQGYSGVLNAIFKTVNHNSPTTYYYYGGTQYPEPAFSASGPHRIFGAMTSAPWIGQPVLDIGPPMKADGIGGSSDPNYYNWGIRFTDSDNNEHGLAFWWNARQWVDAANRGTDEYFLRNLYAACPPSSPGAVLNASGWYGCPVLTTANAGSAAHAMAAGDPAHGTIEGSTPDLTSVSPSAIYSPSLPDFSGTISNLVAVATSFSCSLRPTFTLEDCGTSATCSSATPLGSVTLDAANTIARGAASGTLTSGHFLAWRVTAGSCTSLQIQASATY